MPPDSFTLRENNPVTPLRLAYMTSISEIAGKQGGEFVGQNVKCPEKGTDLGYRMGHLESLIKDISENRGEIAKLIQIVAVVYHDTAEQMEKMDFDGMEPKGDTNWPWSNHLPAYGGRMVGEITHHVPMYTSEWREAKSKGDLELTHNIRASREQTLSDLLDGSGVDVVLTDSPTYIFQGDMAMLKNVARRPIINIHPAILEGQAAIPGLFPTASALMRFNKGEILGPRRAVIEVPHLKGYRGHGATLHKTVAAIDAGSIIHAQENSEMIYPGMSQQELRHAVFELSRNVLRDGLIKFAKERRESMNRTLQFPLQSEPLLADAS